MTPQAYVAALGRAGVDVGLPVGKIDREAASLLKIDQRTAQRYRCGEIAIPGPVQVALEALAAVRKAAP